MFSTNMRNLANKLINKFGDSIVLIETVKGAYNPDTGLTTDTITEHNIKGSISSFSSSDILPASTKVDDLTLLMYASDFALTKAWDVRYKNVIYNIVDFTKTSTQDEEIYYVLQLRGK